MRVQWYWLQNRVRIFAVTLIPMVNSAYRLYRSCFKLIFRVEVKLDNRIEAVLIDDADFIFADELDSAGEGSDSVFFAGGLLFEAEEVFGDFEDCFVGGAGFDAKLRRVNSHIQEVVKPRREQKVHITTSLQRCGILINLVQ